MIWSIDMTLRHRHYLHFLQLGNIKSILLNITRVNKCWKVFIFGWTIRWKPQILLKKKKLLSAATKAPSNLVCHQLRDLCHSCSLRETSTPLTLSAMRATGKYSFPPPRCLIAGQSEAMHGLMQRASGNVVHPFRTLYQRDNRPHSFSFIMREHVQLASWVLGVEKELLVVFFSTLL